MNHTVLVEPSGRRFQVQDGERILAAAIRQGVPVPYSCRDGTCGSCKCRKLKGQVDLGPHQPSALSEAEKAAGYILPCVSTAQSELVLESHRMGAANAHPIMRMPARIASMRPLSHDTMQLRLQLAASSPFQYHAGQYIDLMLRSGQRRSYSIANARHTLRADGPPILELHVRHAPGGRFSDHVFAGMKPREMLRLEGPYGDSFLREGASRPIILLAAGTGIAPIKAMIEHLEFMQDPRPCALYWGCRRPCDLYLDAWLGKMATKCRDLRYVPVISDALPEDAWTGRDGWVHEAVLADFPDLSGHQVYACGSLPMVNAARDDFCREAGLPTQEFFADAFTTEADKLSASAHA